MNRIILFTVIILLSAGRLVAQQGSSPAVLAKDSTLNTAALKQAGSIKAQMMADTLPFVTPKKIGLFSAIVPGLGQFHNKQYWKIGVIYALVGTSVYFLADNIKNYNALRVEYAAIKTLDPSYVRKYPEYNETNVKDAMDYYRKNLDLTALLTGVGYTLQVIDAVVFAHLKGFDISQDISLNLQPVLTPQGGAGIGLVMRF